MRADTQAFPLRLSFFFRYLKRATDRVFFALLCLMGKARGARTPMSKTDTTAANDAELASELAAELGEEGPKKKPSRKRAASRQPGRPHKRLVGEVLHARTEQLRKKLEVLVAKRILISERLEAYEQEVALRKAGEGAEGGEGPEGGAK